MDIYLVTPLLLPLVSKRFLFSKTFAVFNLSATGQCGVSPGGLFQASTVPQILFRAMDSHTSLS